MALEGEKIAKKIKEAFYNKDFGYVLFIKNISLKQFARYIS